MAQRFVKLNIYYNNLVAYLKSFKNHFLVWHLDKNWRSYLKFKS